ncbi:MAG: DUF975 family protein, partial [Treponema sp.]|nr:DUF975 family protein [Treponema sp.]
MFNRPKYKDFARIQLRSRWTIPVMSVLVTMIFLRVFSIPLNLYIDSFRIREYLMKGDIENYVNAFFEMNSMVIYGLAFIVLIISFVLEMASVHLYLKMSRSPDPVVFGDYVEGYSSWWKAIRCGLWNFLFTFLWSLLLFVPGFIKMFSYSQMYFLLDEFPQLTVRESMKISMKITKGHKMDLFILDLSFFGWGFLEVITGNLAAFYVRPYYYMTKINAYHALLKEAVDAGKISIGELRNEKK